MTQHLVRMGGVLALVALCISYPFLPGNYDGMALALSTMAQAFGLLGLLLVPVGVLWLAYELWKRGRRKRNLPAKARGYHFALASVIAATMVALAVSLVGFAIVGFSLGFLTLALWLYIVSRLVQSLKLLKKAEAGNFNPAPLYLVFLPVAVLLFQLVLAAPAIEFSRNRAIANSAKLITAIEEYRTKHGRYPGALSAVWKDYYLSVVGVEKFHYAPHGDAYNLFFEQPRFLLDNIGTREFAVYNKLDEQVMLSHTSWILIWPREKLETRQGWYAVHEAASPHWKYFWFD